MNKPLQVTLAIRSGAVMALVATFIADLTRTGQVIALIDASEEDNEIPAAMVEQIRARSGRVAVALQNGDLDGLPPNDQLEQWGLAELATPDPDDDDEDEEETDDVDTAPVVSAGAGGTPVTPEGEVIEPSTGEQNPVATEEGSSEEPVDMAADMAQAAMASENFSASVSDTASTTDATSPGE